MKTFNFVLFLFVSGLIFSQDTQFSSEDISINEFVDGTLLTPNINGDLPLVIIIPGSGPTDRNGNQNFLNNNSLKKLALGLAENGVASFRMDKRVVKQLKRGNYDLDVLFDDFVTDVSSVVDYFGDDPKFNKIFILGHSQGSLVGMLAVDDNIDGFISVAGAGRSIDEVLIEQVAKTAPGLKDDTARVLQTLKSGSYTEDYPPALASFLNRDLQPFMMSWIKHKPTEIISELNIPALIINGTKDLQVSVDEAKLLNDAAKDSELVIVEKMNHVLFIIEGDDLENSKSYNEPQRSISPELLSKVASFIKN